MSITQEHPRFEEIEEIFSLSVRFDEVKKKELRALGKFVWNYDEKYSDAQHKRSDFYVGPLIVTELPFKPLNPKNKEGEDGVLICSPKIIRVQQTDQGVAESCGPFGWWDRKVSEERVYDFYHPAEDAMPIPQRFRPFFPKDLVYPVYSNILEDLIRDDESENT